LLHVFSGFLEHRTPGSATLIVDVVRLLPPRSHNVREALQPWENVHGRRCTNLRDLRDPVQEFVDTLYPGRIEGRSSETVHRCEDQSRGKATYVVVPVFWTRQELVCCGNALCNMYRERVVDRLGVQHGLEGLSLQPPLITVPEEQYACVIGEYYAVSNVVLWTVCVDCSTSVV